MTESADTRSRCEETMSFIKFLYRNNRVDDIGQHKNTRNCIQLPGGYSAIATEDHKETRKHLDRINTQYEPLRQHSLTCGRCTESLDAIFVFKAYHNIYLFPKKIQRIITQQWEEKYDPKRKLFIMKLPAPHSGTWLTKGRLVYNSKGSIQEGIEEFNERFQKPLDLKMLIWDEEIEHRKIIGKRNKPYFQANAHHKHTDWHTHISIRSRTKS